MNEVYDISELNINDSTLLRTLIFNDSIEMELDYIADYETQEIVRAKLLFEECRRVEFLINPGFDTPNSLLDAVEEGTPEARKIKIETNTTAGTIRIECSKVYFQQFST